MPVPAAQPASLPSTSINFFAQEPRLLSPSHLGSSPRPGCFHPSHILGRALCPCGDTIRMVGMFLTPNPDRLGLGTFLFCPSCWTCFKPITPTDGNTKEKASKVTHTFPMKTKGSFLLLPGWETTTAFQAIAHQCYQILENYKRKPKCLQRSALLALLTEVASFTPNI